MIGHHPIYLHGSSFKIQIVVFFRSAFGKIRGSTMHLISLTTRVLLCLICVVESGEQSVNSRLHFVQCLFRHGDRNPSATFSTDFGNQESTWKNGFGELTELGIKQQYRLGQFLRKRYSNFLSPDYNAQEIHMRSTGYNRTIMSALANLAGMYPPKGEQIWDKNLTWQPIPVHNRPREDDPTLWMDKSCPTVTDLYKTRVFTSEEYLGVENSNIDFLNWVREKTGRKTLHLIDLWAIFDPLFCELNHKDTHQWPEWVNETVYKKIGELYTLSVGFYYHLPEIQRLRGGLLFNEIAGRMIEKIQNASQYIYNLKYYAYSIHDSTQVALLENLGAFDGSIPTYNQLLVLELHEKDDKYYIELYKINDTESDQIFAVPLPICGEPCFAEKFLESSTRKKPDDWYSECGISRQGFIPVGSKEDDAI